MEETVGAHGGADNQRHWDEMAGVHRELAAQGGNAYYDAAALREGRSTLLAVERRGLEVAVGSVQGLRVLHLQCHLGQDAITLTRQGAEVVGLDFSAEALAGARALAEECGVEITWVQADAVSPPPELHGRFDLVYATIGILCWIEDVGAWMAAVRRVLRPGGRLLLVDLHPLFLMVDAVEPLDLGFPYESDGAVELAPSGSYADAGSGATTVGTSTAEYAHGLGRIVTAAVRAGLVVEHLSEDTEVEIDPRGDVLERDDSDGLYRLRIDGQLLPTTYTLVASAP